MVALVVHLMAEQAATGRGQTEADTTTDRISGNNIGSIMAKTYQKFALQRASKEAALFDPKRNRRTFKDLKALIEKLRVDPFGECDLLLRLQNQLTRHILRTEKGLKILKDERLRILGLRKNRPSRETSDVLKKRVKRLEQGLEQGKHLLWIWRCFGDAIPFIYHSKHALKHMLYSVEDYTVKQSAGALFGNEGRRLESKIMQTFCRQGVPSVLCDLTNTLRHGDVCVMVDADPFPIEVKSSANQNARTVRQIGNLTSLRAFFSDDGASNFRGVERVERRETPMAETHVADLKRCLEESREKLWAIARPEDGLTYLTLRRGVDFGHIESEEMGEYPNALIWNNAIASEAWMPYYPFTLTIERAADLVALLEDRLVVIVAVDAHAVMKRFADRRFIATFMRDEKVAFTVRRPNTSIDRGDAACGVSTHLMRRVQFECESIESLINFSVKFVEDLEAMEPLRQDECSEQDAQMAAAWRKLEPMIPPLITDDGN
jgi:hypothetical protein